MRPRARLLGPRPFCVAGIQVNGSSLGSVPGCLSL